MRSRRQTGLTDVGNHALEFAFRRVLGRVPSDPRRGMAALSLARLLLATDPGRAAAVLNDSFAAVPRALQEDAWARRAEAEGRAGHLVEAARLAHEYQRRFPSGRRSDEVQRWSNQ